MMLAFVEFRRPDKSKFCVRMDLITEFSEDRIVVARAAQVEEIQVLATSQEISDKLEAVARAQQRMMMGAPMAPLPEEAED